MNKNFLIVSNDYGSISAARMILADSRVNYVMGQDQTGHTYVMTETLGFIKYQFVLNKLETEISRGAKFEIIFMK